MKKQKINLINEEELGFSFIRSSGPGGQHINKVSTGVQLRFNIRESKYLTDKIKNKILSSESNRINKQGTLIIEAKSFRSQEKNKADAIARLETIIIDAHKTKKRRKKTFPTGVSIENRIRRKKNNSLKKRLRKKVNSDNN